MGARHQPTGLMGNYTTNSRVLYNAHKNLTKGDVKKIWEKVKAFSSQTRTITEPCALG